MNGLEAEADRYAEEQNSAYCNDYYGFIAGATSNYVKKQTLKFAIEQLKSISLGLMDANTVTVSNLLEKIYELEQNLKDYEQTKLRTNKDTSCMVGLYGRR